MSAHPTIRLTAPDGGDADIDIALAPLIEALWAAGYDTITCCQDHGEALAGHDRKSAYWAGYVLIELPYEDGCRLLDAVKDTLQFRDRMHWAAPGAWEVSMQVMASCPGRGEVMASCPGRGDPAGALPWAQVHFPKDQVDDLVKVLG